MELTGLTSYSPDDTLNAMAVARDCEEMKVILEGYGRMFGMEYKNWKHDPKPKLLILGRWKNTRTGTTLMCGININYLDADEIKALRKALPQILKQKTLRLRYEAGKALLPHMFYNFYRTYNQDHVHDLSPSTLKFWNDKEIAAAVATAAAQPMVKVGKTIAQTRSQKAAATQAQTAADKKSRTAALLGTSPTPPQDEIKRSKEDPFAQTPSEIKRKERADALRAKLKKDDAEAEAKKIQKLGQEEEEKQEEIEPKKKETLDPLKPLESRLADLDAILEELDDANCEPTPMRWINTKDYRKWHEFDAFFSIHPSTGKPVIESTAKGKFLAIYDVIDDKLIVDVGKSYAEMLHESGWGYDHTVCLSYDGKDLDAFYEHPRGAAAVEMLMEGKLGTLIGHING